MDNSNTKTYLRALTIGGSDSGGGAGIQADLKTFSALGCYGMSVITALTAQNTQGVHGVFEVTASFVGDQLNAVLDDIGVDVVKIGMLHQPEIIQTVSSILKDKGVEQIVLDPVMFAKGGDRLIRDDAIEMLRSELVPLATVLTPNIPEASELLRRSLKTRDHMVESAAGLCDLGPKAVVIKGGHLDIGGSDDYVLLSGNEKGEWLVQKRVETNNLHGAGCTFAAAIAAGMTRSTHLPEVIRQAKQFVSEALTAGSEYQLGRGQGPVAHFYKLWNT